MTDKVLLVKKDGVGIITLNKPEGLNSLDLEMREVLKSKLAEVARDPEIGAVIIAGSGKSFCAGGDINTMSDIGPNDGRKRLKNIQIAIRSIMSMEKPVIAAVQGYATGAGMNIALACDLVIAADDAKFCQSFTKIGLVPDCGGFFNLPRRVGIQKAKELIFLAPMIDAQTALELGIVNRVVPAEQLTEEAWKMATKLAKSPGIAIGVSKTILNSSYETNLEESFNLEAFAQDLCMQTQDFREGISAFKEKRKPVFRGK